MRILGVDFGRKKIGFAFGESDSSLVFPLDVVLVPDDLTKAVQVVSEYIKKEGVDICVVGLPIPPKGGDSPQLLHTKDFIEALKNAVEIPVHTVDEAYTSKEGQRLKEENSWKAEEDAIAAALILEQFLGQR